jgi:pimeloyl-ACP methyl ester carboxylesterase
MSSSSAPLSTPEGPGSVSGAPNLPDGFTDTFTSRYIDTAEVRLHAVIGGEGPPLLLVHGWPQTWYQWRLVMPQLARDFEVAADDVQTVVIPDTGHWLAEEAPDEFLAALRDFLAPYRESRGGLR